MNNADALRGKRIDKARFIGQRFIDFAGEWQLVGQNDLFVPYFSKVVGDKVQKKQYTIRNSERWFIN